MSLARKMKRQFERDSRRKDMKALWAHVDKCGDLTEKKLRREYEEARITEDAKNMTYAMYYLFGIQLHRIFGFGQQRCLRLFNAVDEELGTWRRGEKTVEMFRKELKDAVDIDLQL